MKAKSNYHVSLTIDSKKLSDLGMRLRHEEPTEEFGDPVYLLEVEVGGDIPILNADFVQMVVSELGERAKFEMEEEAITSFAKVTLSTVAIR